MTFPKDHENFTPPPRQGGLSAWVLKRRPPPIWDVTFSFTPPPPPPKGSWSFSITLFLSAEKSDHNIYRKIAI